MANRPLSPHLQIWKWGPHMRSRSFTASPATEWPSSACGVLLWWLGALASGPDAYETFHTPCLQLVWHGGAGRPDLGILQSHGSGLRHFVLDIGAGYELETNRTCSVVSIIAGIVLTAAFWAFILLR